MKVDRLSIAASPFRNNLKQSFFFQHLARHTKTFKRLRHPAINPNHMNDCPNFLFAYAIGQSETVMDFPLSNQHNPDLFLGRVPLTRLTANVFDGSVSPFTPVR